MPLSAAKAGAAAQSANAMTGPAINEVRMNDPPWVKNDGHDARGEVRASDTLRTSAGARGSYGAPRFGKNAADFTDQCASSQLRPTPTSTFNGTRRYAAAVMCTRNSASTSSATSSATS